MPDMAQPLPNTLLSYARYIRLLGANPVHAHGAAGDDTWAITQNSCQDIWPRHSWQSANQISEETIRQTIRQAEREIAEELGWWPGPTWTAQEIGQFAQHYRRDVYRRYGRGNRGQRVGLKTKFAKIIAPGVRNTSSSPIATATVAANTLRYTDEDGDGFFETATVRIATTLTDATEVKVYFADTEADERWEIRPPNTKTISNGIFTATFDSWLFIDPDLRSVYPSQTGFRAVNVTTVDNYVTSVDVYREYNDPTQASSTFYWEPTPRSLVIDGCCSNCAGTGCPACSLTTQDGCLHIRDADRGIVVPQPATYDEDEGSWTQNSYTECRDPDYVQIWYYSGDLSRRYLRNTVGFDEQLDDYWAQAIFWLATARMRRPFCGCATIKAYADQLQDNLAAMQSRQVQATSYQIDPELVLRSRFGTRVGEVMAWQRVKENRDRILGGGSV